LWWINPKTVPRDRHAIAQQDTEARTLYGADSRPFIAMRATQIRTEPPKKVKIHGVDVAFTSNNEAIRMVVGATVLMDDRCLRIVTPDRGTPLDRYP
jgi:hypothetical protein